MMENLAISLSVCSPSGQVKDIVPEIKGSAVGMKLRCIFPSRDSRLIRLVVLRHDSIKRGLATISRMFNVER